MNAEVRSLTNIYFLIVIDVTDSLHFEVLSCLVFKKTHCAFQHKAAFKHSCTCGGGCHSLIKSNKQSIMGFRILPKDNLMCSQTQGSGNPLSN